MDEIVVITNCVVYLITFLFLFRKRRKLTLGTFLLLCYAICAFFCIINYRDDPHHWHLAENSWWFIYLYVAIILLLLPFLTYDYEIKPGININSAFYRQVAWIYIIMAAIACVVYIPVAYEAIANPNWSDLYDEAHEETQRSLLSKLPNMFFHLRFLGITLLFYFSTKKVKDSLFISLLWIMALLPLLLSTISQASRGGFIEIFTAFFMEYLIFKKALPTKLIKKLKYLVLATIPMAVMYLWAVTFSRFNDSYFADSAEGSIINYLGQSMLYFVYGVADSIKKYGWGDYMLTTGASENLSMNGTHFGTNFITIIGNLYLDLGPVFAVVFILVFNLFWKKLSKRNIGIPEAFLLITWGQTIFRGVFVLGRGWMIQLIEAFVIYALLRWLQTDKNDKYQSYSRC